MLLVEKMPGLRALSYRPAKGLDGGDGAIFWVFNGSESADAIGAALASPDGQATTADISNYSPASLEDLCNAGERLMSEIETITVDLPRASCIAGRRIDGETLERE